MKSFLSLFVLFMAVLAQSLSHDAAAAPVTTSNAAWQAIHEVADDKTTTSTAYIDTAKGDRFSLTINALKKQKVCALVSSSPPPVVAKEYKGKMLVDGQTVWEGKIVTVPDPMTDIFFLDIGFDWTVPLEGLRHGKELVIEYGAESGKTARVKFTLTGSTKAINSIIDTQSKLAESDEVTTKEKTP